MISKEAVVAYFDALEPYLCEGTKEIHENMESNVRGTGDIETHHLSDADEKSCPLRQPTRVSFNTKFYRNPSSGCSAESCRRTDQLLALLALSLFISIKMTDILIKNEGLMNVFRMCGNNVIECPSDVDRFHYKVTSVELIS
jgi:hypothetical protein